VMFITNPEYLVLPMPIILAILVAHWIADFIAQTDQMAKNKSTSNKWLISHVITYGATMGLLMIIMLTKFPLVWLVVNTLAHGATDYVTSRITSRLWKANEVHWFFVVVGLDQLIHMMTMFITAAYLF
jgi:Protein of unknown function (DUF3307)